MVLIRTHFIRWYDGCARWVWDYLTPGQWGRLRHIGHAVVLWPCIGGPPVAIVLTPSPTIEVNPHSPQAWAPAAPPDLNRFGSDRYAGMLPPDIHAARRVAASEPASIAVFGVALAGLRWLRNRAKTKPPALAS